MTRLSHTQWSCLHHLSLQAHLARNEQELIDLVLREVPRAFGINYTVWHEKSKNCEFGPEKSHLLDTYRDAVRGGMGLLAETITTHPTFVGLGMTDKIEFPEDRAVSMTDFATTREIRETAVYREIYRHIDVEDHVSVDFWYDDDTGVALCFNAQREYKAETKLMIHLLRQHLSIAFNRFKQAQADKKRSELTIPNLNYDSLTKRERETLPHLLNGKSNSEIAIILGISPRTSEKHVASIIEKTGAENRKTLISEAKYHGF